MQERKGKKIIQIIIILILILYFRPQFIEEIKLQLPSLLTEDHHLLFTILNHPNDEVLGYAYCPVFSSTHG